MNSSISRHSQRRWRPAVSAGAGLDVFDPEPLPPDDALWDLPNVIISPHNSGSSDGTTKRVADVFFDNLGRFVRNEPLRNEVKI